MILSKFLLFPYYLTLKIRNSRYDNGKSKVYGFPIPVISVGNVNVGGTGKTPMCELLVRFLAPYYKVAVLSMGYRRKTKGFRIVSVDDTAQAVGDEPLQIKRKFPGITVVVDKQRERAVKTLLEAEDSPRPDVIILDDGFQYRRLKRNKEIVLIDYNRPVFKDNLLPFGRLRDLPEQIRRAHAVVITKTPEYTNVWEREKTARINRIRPEQTVIFTKCTYLPPAAVFEKEGDKRYIYSKEVLLFSGIANDESLVFHLSDSYDKIFHKTYADHHEFSRMDMAELKRFARKNPLALLLTTEKDAQRLLHNRHLSPEVKKRLFYIPIAYDFISDTDRREFSTFLFNGLPLATKKKPASRSKQNRMPEINFNREPEWKTLF